MRDLIRSKGTPGEDDIGSAIHLERRAPGARDYTYTVREVFELSFELEVLIHSTIPGR